MYHKEVYHKDVEDIFQKFVYKIYQILMHYILSMYHNKPQTQT